jgi:heme o synthase
VTNNSFFINLKLAAELSKIRISVPVALTTFTGYILSRGAIDQDILWPTVGIFLLASGASALNQVQEKDMDLRMHRTFRRPIPSGRITTHAALVISAIFFISGSLVLGLGGGWLPLVIGLSTFIWYNGIYTYLKRFTAFAVVPGSVVGALPPLVGWTAAGGLLSHPSVMMIAFFFFIGQIPHFWLILLKYGQEYETAGFPSITSIFTPTQIKRLTFTWITATAISAMLLPFYGIIQSTWGRWILMMLAFALVLSFLNLIGKRRAELKIKTSFVRINIFYLLLMILMCLDTFI